MARQYWKVEKWDRGNCFPCPPPHYFHLARILFFEHTLHDIMKFHDVMYSAGIYNDALSCVPRHGMAQLNTMCSARRFRRLCRYRSSGILAKRSLPAMPLVHRPSSAPMPTFMPVTKEEDNGDDDEDKRLRTPPSTSPWRTLASTSPTGNTLYSLSEMSGSYSRRGLPFPTTPASTTPHSPVALGTKRQSFPVGTSRSAHSLGIRV